MTYQVLARKWRPQTFDTVVGQEAVTRTLRNALKSGRLAHAFVFAGPRGVGKTTTARILARALNCVSGPTPDPCGTCDACVEIAEGRDIDVLEIDAATHTGVDNVREVIVSGLAITPVRNRYKIFIIDEVHQLSTPSFNALLKSIEEPPPHVVFMMATTELEKIPETVRSRSQVYEFRTIGTKAIADQLRKIVEAEGITVGEESLLLIARDAEGSMRDAQSKLDQVIAFTGTTIAVEDVSTVLGLVGRDLLLDTLDAVAKEDAPAAFALAARAVELGYDLKLVCRELSRVVRDLLVLSVDAARIHDPEIAAEGERDRLKELGSHFSREDLLRAFDLLTRAESDIRAAAQPRYHLELALLRWIYLRKLVPIEDLLVGSDAPGSPERQGREGGSRTAPTVRPVPATAPTAPQRTASAPSRPIAAPPTGTSASQHVPPSPTSLNVPPSSTALGMSPPITSIDMPPPSSALGMAPPTTSIDMPPPQGGGFKDALLAEIRKSKAVFYNTVVAQAQKIEAAGDRVTFTFAPQQRTLRDMFEQNRAWLETAAQHLSGRRVAVDSAQTAAPIAPPAAGDQQPAAASVSPADRKSALKAEALADAGVQALLDVFPAEIRDVEEM